MTAPAMHSTLWAYLWDLVDDGLDDAVRRVADTGLDALSVATAYHTFQQLRPHRPGAKLLTEDRAALYFQPDPSIWSGTALRPHVADLARSGNPLAALADACSRQGVDLISWTVCLHNTYLAGLHPECAQRGAYGDSLGWHLCPAAPEVRSYVVALARDLAVNYGCRRIELESCSYGGYGHGHHHVKDGVDLGPGGRYLFGLCFCDACVSRGRDLGLDVQVLRQWVRQRLDPVFGGAGPIEEGPGDLVEEGPCLAQYQAMRQEQVTSLAGEVAAACPEAQTSIILMGDRWTAGLVPAALIEAVDLVEVLAYSESTAAVAEGIDRVTADLPDPAGLVLGLQAYPPATRQPDTLASHVEAARSKGLRDLSFYNYGIMPESSFAWVRRSLAG